MTEPEPQTAPQVLVVDDDQSTHQTLEFILRRKGYGVETAATAGEALALAEERFFNAALVDLKLPDQPGTDVIQRLKELHPDTAVIVMTGYASVESAVEAMSHDASGYITKPMNMDEVLAELDKCVEKQRLVFENRRLFEAARRELLQRKRLERELLAVSEAERRRVGGDLHDTLGQQLAGVLFILDSLRDRLADQDLPEAEEADRAADSIGRAIEQTRALARGLCPVIQEPDGLMDTLVRLAEDTEDQHGVACRFRCEAPVLIPDNTVATHLYRIVQEAVTNAVRHAECSSVRITLTQDDQSVTLRVEDDGVGLPEDVPSQEGMGLHTMAYRAQAIGGALNLAPGEAGGTTVTCTIPVHNVNRTESLSHEP